MRLLRRFLVCLALLTAFVAIIGAAAFLPIVQTWMVNRALAGHPGQQASVGAVSAGRANLRVANLRLQRDGIVLTVPTLEAALPLKDALWDRNVLIRSVVAKGWTLDLSRRPAATGEGAPGAAVATSKKGEGPATDGLARTVVREFRGLLGGGETPGDVSLDGVDLEGDVLVATQAGKETVRVHLIIKGGGLAAGRAGDFTLDASGPVMAAAKSPTAVSVRGRLGVAMGSARTVNRIEFEGKLSAPDGSLPDDLVVAARVVAADGAKGESYTLDLGRGSRRLFTVAAGFATDQRGLQGKWTLDLQDSDVARFLSERAFPALTTAGEGSFAIDPAFTRVQVAGRVKANVSRWAGFVPGVVNLGAVALETEFDLTRTGPSLRIERLEVAMVGTRPIAVARAVQPFSFDGETGALTVADPAAEWLEGSLQGWPIAGLAGLGDGIVFAGGDVTGDFAVKAVTGGFALRAKAPLVATGVSVRQGDRVLGQGLDLSLALRAEHTPQGWRVQGAPLLVSSAGRRLATIEATWSPPAEARARFALEGTWSAELEALATQPAFAGLGPMKGRATSGNFSVSGGKTTEIKSTVNLTGPAPDHSVTASVRASVDVLGGGSFQIPLTLTVGTKATKISANGQWAKEKTGPRVAMEFSGVEVALDHLHLLAASWCAWGGVAWPALADGADGERLGSAGVRDTRPFWGDWMGRVKFSFYSLKTEDQELNEVAGTLGLEHGALRLEGARAVLAPPRLGPERGARGAGKAEPPRNRVTAEGSLTFDAAAEWPYSLKATAAVDVVEAARLFTAAQAERDPVIEGRFSLTDVFTGNGRSLPNLVDRRREEFRLASKGGIVRLLKANVAASIPEVATPVADSLAKVGSLVGALFGVKKEYIDPGTNRLSKATEAVLDFTSQIPEIRYDQMAITATREADRTIRVTEIAIHAPNERLTGSGEMDYVKGQPLRAQPLRMDLQIGVRGRPAQLLATAGLLSPDKDEQGYTLLRQPIRFGGTLEQIDNRAWRDLLLKAATPTAERGKKGG